ncbi:hypothetical protein [Methanobrevibacter curvatus]|uniref:Uncharacterized protein n=1 Tax=Methanobrevibacter curvatus TaxID=49547 RepID=A0A166CAK5_9EURY|nr:hypothetical protein [Methanobrevibacter curvatus]KZX14303.1 hypothetical protein MBCUR_05270 [Methanobrevibacter curvatus]
MLKELKEIFYKYDFVSVEFANGHQHTIKAYCVGNINPKTLKSSFNANWEYITFVEKNENTEIINYLYSNSEAEAIKQEIITEEGGFL